MSTLFVMFDLETGRFIGSSLKGQFLGGLAEVHLGPGYVSVRDSEGRDLLAPEGAAVPTPDQPLTAVQQGIAACFGSDVPSAAPDDDEGGPIDQWDFRRWSR